LIVAASHRHDAGPGHREADPACHSRVAVATPVVAMAASKAAP
jgi:hypothetical protein